MSVTIPISVVRDFVTVGPIQGVFEVLADVPNSVSHFPQVKQLVSLGDDKYRWEMERMGTQNHFFQVQYVTQYTRSETEKWIRWSPIPDGNGSFRGCWELRREGNKTLVHFENTGHLELPFPRLLKRVVKPFVEKQFHELLEQYLSNLQRTFDALSE